MHVQLAGRGRTSPGDFSLHRLLAWTGNVRLCVSPLQPAQRQRCDAARLAPAASAHLESCCTVLPLSFIACLQVGKDKRALKVAKRKVRLANVVC